MSRTRNATHGVAIAALAALLAAPLASAATRPPVQRTQVKQAIHALVVRGQALDRSYHLGPYAHPSTQAVRRSPDSRTGTRPRLPPRPLRQRDEAGCRSSPLPPLPPRHHMHHPASDVTRVTAA